MDESKIVCCESELLIMCFSNALKWFTSLKVAFIYHSKGKVVNCLSFGGVMGSICPGNDL